MIELHGWGCMTKACWGCTTKTYWGCMTKTCWGCLLYRHGSCLHLRTRCRVQHHICALSIPYLCQDVAPCP